MKDNISLGHYIRDTDWSTFTDEVSHSILIDLILYL